MLRLVHPAPRGKGTRPPSERRPHRGPSLTLEESRRLKIALKNLRRAYGGWDVLANLTGFAENTLELVAYAKRERGSSTLAIAVARIAGIPVEQLLSGRPTVAGACAFCGRRGGS